MTEHPPETSKPAYQATKPAGSAGKTKIEVLRQLLSRRNGATPAQIQSLLVWQPHTVRAAISRLRQSGLSIELDRSCRVARYRVVSGADR